MLERANVPRITWLRCILPWAIVAGSAISIGILGADRAVRATIKLALTDLDARVADGLFRRLYHGERLPLMNQELPPNAPEAYEWIGNAPLLAIGHGLGPWLVGGPNTLPTFAAGWRMGFRVFEVDVALTRDDRLICYHGDDAAHELDTLTFDGYLQTTRRVGMEPCVFEDLVRIARERPDVRFVLDVKNRFQDVYGGVRRAVSAAHVGRTFIPQIYSFDELPEFRRDSLFGGVIFTSYRSALTTDQILSAAVRSGVRAVTLTLPEFQHLRRPPPTGVAIFVHPVDDAVVATLLRLRGARGIYTSYLAPFSVPPLFTDWSGDRAPPLIRILTTR